MKKFLALISAVALLITGCDGEQQHELPKSDGNAKIGVITRLNADEQEFNQQMSKLDANYRPSTANISAQYKYFDKMNDMQLALESGQIDLLSTYQNVAEYMIQRSNNKEILSGERKLEDTFCFAVREGDKMLKNELDKAIKAMTADGTLANLSKKYIIDLKNGDDPPEVKINHIDGAKTIKVAVTGDLPPFDMILADATPAGFSIAVLAEVSKRINKNIEIISVDSVARASILASKGADVVFWVAVPKNSNLFPENIDKPTGIAVSEPYYRDFIAHVGLKE